jgi:glycerol uptake facilitator-like aquaporin
MLSCLALQAEFLGTLLFVFASATVSSSLAVGMAYAVASYATAAISGGHLNPGPLFDILVSNTMSVVLIFVMSAAFMLTDVSLGCAVLTLAQAFSGHAHFATAGLYVVAQLLGSIAGERLWSGLDSCPACPSPASIVRMPSSMQRMV